MQELFTKLMLQQLASDCRNVSKNINIRLSYFIVNAENSQNMYNWLKSVNANARVILFLKQKRINNRSNIMEKTMQERDPIGIFICQEFKH